MISNWYEGRILRFIWTCEPGFSYCNRPAVRHCFQGHVNQTKASVWKLCCKQMNYKWNYSILHRCYYAERNNKIVHASECAWCLLLFTELNEYFILKIVWLNTTISEHVIKNIFSEMFNIDYIRYVILQTLI